jgi:hypothetical protein
MQILELSEQAQSNSDWEASIKKLLENKGLKRDFGSYDKNPGGNRTYVAQLNCLGLLFKENNKIVLTAISCVCGMKKINQAVDFFTFM